MKTYYESPKAEIVDFTAREQLAVVEKSSDPNADLGDDPTAGLFSRDF